MTFFLHEILMSNCINETLVTYLLATSISRSLQLDVNRPQHSQRTGWDKWVKTTNIQSQCTNKTLNTFSHSASMFVITLTKKYSSLRKKLEPFVSNQTSCQKCDLGKFRGLSRYQFRLLFCSLQNNNKFVVIYTSSNKLQ